MRPMYKGVHQVLAVIKRTLKEVTIGDGGVVGVGAVVAHDIPAGATVIGNPVRVVGAEAF